MDKATKLFTLRAEERLKHLGINKSDLARRLGVPPGNVSNYLLGKVKPGLEQIAKYAKALECEPSFLTGAETTIVEVEVGHSRLEIANEMLRDYLPDGERKDAILLLLTCDPETFNGVVGGLRPFFKLAKESKGTSSG